MSLETAHDSRRKKDPHMTNPTPAAPAANTTPSTITPLADVKTNPVAAKVEPAAVKVEVATKA